MQMETVAETSKVSEILRTFARAPAQRELRPHNCGGMDGPWFLVGRSSARI